jgi:fermentation-respiration switch protein FrsA (DUF1100 family)
MNFLYRSPLAKKVTGVVLDSPVLDLSATIDFGGRQLDIPGPFVRLGQFIAGLRFEIDWKALDYLGRAHMLLAPILLFHGDADGIIPVETSDLLAKERPGIVTYHRVPNATHIRSWNMNPPAYETAVLAFLKNAIREKK